MKRPILDIRYGAITGILLLGMTLTITAMAQTPEIASNSHGKAFKTLSLSLVVASVADVETTQRGYGLGFHENNSLITGLAGTQRPGRAVMYSMFLASDAACAYTSYRLKKAGKRYWWVPMTAAIGVHAFGITRNAIVQTRTPAPPKGYRP